MSDRWDALRKLELAATLGPWRACGDDRGGCICGQVWSITSDHPVAVVEQGEWGDTYPALKTSGDTFNQHVTAVIEKIAYGHIDPEVAKRNALLIAAARNAIPELLKENAELEAKLEAMQRELKAGFELAIALESERDELRRQVVELLNEGDHELESDKPPF